MFGTAVKMGAVLTVVLAGQTALAQPGGHGERVAKLNRVVDVAEDDRNAALVARAQVALTKENARHAAAMAQIQTKEGAR